MKLNMKMPKLSQQAMIVAVAAVLPVLASAYKLRIMDAAVLALSGALAVYNVNCLTAGSCNTWATVVSISFFIMTIMQLMAPREGMEGEKETTVEVADEEVVVEAPTETKEVKAPAAPEPTVAKMPAETKPNGMSKIAAAPIATTETKAVVATTNSVPANDSDYELELLKQEFDGM
jgi:hypothetical protein